MALKWRFLDYETKDGDVPIRDWYSAEPGQVQSAFDTTVRHLSVTEIWTVRDGAKPLTRQHVGLTELLVDIDVWAARAARGVKRRFRPVGVRNDDEGTFLFLGGCSKVGGMLDPITAFDDAMRRWDEWQRGLGKVHDHEL